MTKPLRILHLEDDPDYSEFVGMQLREGGIEHELFLVSTRAGFEDALTGNSFDLILADYLLPDFDGLQALALAREHCPQVPFLLVSGTIGEQAAIDSLRNGATDYVLKHCPERLTPAIRRAAREAEERARRRQAEAEVHRRETYFRKLTENCLDLLTIIDHDGILLYSSPSIARVLGYHPSELRGICVFSLVHPEDLPRVTATFEQLLSHADWTLTLEFRCKHREGLWIDLEAVGRNQLADRDINGVVITSRNVTDRKRAEDCLRQSEEQYRLIFDSNPMPMWIFDHDSLRILEVNDAAVQHYGYSREEFLRMTLADMRPASDGPAMIEYLHQLVQSDVPSNAGLLGNWVHCKKDGSLIQVELRWGAVTFRGHKASLAMVNDITNRCRVSLPDALTAVEREIHEYFRIVLEMFAGR